MISCPSVADLLCAREHALAPDENRTVLSHLRACADCQAQLADIEAVVRAGRIHASNAAHRAARFRRVLDEAEAKDIAAGMTAARWWRWSVAVLIPFYCVCLLPIWLPAPPTVDDALAQSRMAERTEREEGVRLRIAIAPTADVRAATAAVWAGGAHPPEPLRRLIVALDAAGVGTRPLSVSAFDAWRRQLRGRRDRVTATGDLLRVETASDEGPIRFGGLTIERPSYRVVGQVWVIEGVGRVEIHKERGVVPTSTESRAVVADARALDLAELRARAALHVWGVDGKVHIARRESQIVVAGPAPAAGTLHGLDAALRGIPHIAVSFAAPGGEQAHARAPRILEPWVVRRLGSPRAGRAVAQDFQMHAASLQERMTVLQALAGRYSSRDARRLSPEAQVLLRTLVDDHVALVRRDLMGVDARLMLFLGANDRCGLVASMPEDWRERVGRAFAPGVRVGERIQTLLLDAQPSTEAVWRREIGESFTDAWNAWCRNAEE